jgi:hypothetical protein
VQERNNELKNTTYEIFIGLLSVLSIVNIVLYYLIPSEDVSAVILIMDAFLTVIFLVDFLYRFFTADSKSNYFFKQYGWADLLASMPIPQLKQHCSSVCIIRNSQVHMYCKLVPHLVPYRRQVNKIPAYMFDPMTFRAGIKSRMDGKPNQASVKSR